MDIFSEDEEIERLDRGAPHVYLLGAGASRAAFPDGDKNGRRLPVMADFVEVLELETILSDAGIEPPFSDFESVYATLSEDKDKAEVARLLEETVYDYFSSLELPDEPTLYDHLLLSLRKKDVVATFNWDPFLHLAGYRNHKFADMPSVLYLHGNVGIGYCDNCRLKDSTTAPCQKCGQPLDRSKLLYPVTKKNYNADKYINAEWATLKKYLAHTYIFTIFGYGAPVSDVEAVELLRLAWGDPESRSLEEIEIIDRLDRGELEARWSDFIHSHHFRISQPFYTALSAKHPRRSCEALWECLMMCRPSDGIEFPEAEDFHNLYKTLQPRITKEKANK